MKRILFFFSLLFLYFSSSFAQSASQIQEYIAKYKAMALEQERKYGVPAPITLAQGIVESAAGTSQLTRKSNNHFGIKNFGGWKGPTTYAWDTEDSWFRVYSSAAASYEDHSRFLIDNGRYRSLFDKSVWDYRGWAWGLLKAGYAGDPNYAKALIGYIEAYRLYEINGGVKLRPGKTVIIKKAITREELVENKEVQQNEEEVSEEEQAVDDILSRIVVSINDVRCTLLYPGETLSSVSMKYDIAPNKLLEYNDTGSETDLHEGDVVFLEKKKRKYNGPQDFYYAANGESMFSIAQRFGIRLSSLAKMNGGDIFRVMKGGEQIRLK